MQDRAKLLTSQVNLFPNRLEPPNKHRWTFQFPQIRSAFAFALFVKMNSVPLQCCGSGEVAHLSNSRS